MRSRGARGMQVPIGELCEAYAYCGRLARTHYENFPVASLLMPRRLRGHIAAVYAFARHADDIADEGHAAPEERRAKLEQWRQQLWRCTDAAAAGDGAGRTAADRPPRHHTRDSSMLPDEYHVREVFMALDDTVRRHDIPLRLFHDLIDAFEQDTWKEHYASFDELLDYCRRSANPVGRIILALFGKLDERTGPPADALCTGLQLVNFWQDISVDRLKPRLYIPIEDLTRFSLSPDDILHGRDSHASRTVIAYEVERTKTFFRDATPLFPLVPLRLRLELSAIWRGGMRVLEKIEKQRYNVIQSRPALSVTDMLSVFSGAVLKGSPDAG